MGKGLKNPEVVFVNFDFLIFEQLFFPGPFYSGWGGGGGGAKKSKNSVCQIFWPLQTILNNFDFFIFDHILFRPYFFLGGGV